MVCKFVTVPEFLFYYIHTDAQQKPDLVDHEEPLQ